MINGYINLPDSILEMLQNMNSDDGKLYYNITFSEKLYNDIAEIAADNKLVCIDVDAPHGRLLGCGFVSVDGSVIAISFSSMIIGVTIVAVKEGLGNPAGSDGYDYSVQAMIRYD